LCVNITFGPYMYSGVY